MTDNEKKIGEPIDDDALDGVAGGIAPTLRNPNFIDVKPIEPMDVETLKITIPSDPATATAKPIVKPEPSVTVEPLNKDTLIRERISEIGGEPIVKVRY